MPFSSSAFGQLRYMTEVTENVTPAAGNGSNLRMTSPTAKAGVKTTVSQEVRSDRLSTGLARTDIDIDGGFNMELSGKEYDPFLEGLLSAAYTHYGTLGLGVTFTFTSAATTITAALDPGGTSAFSTIPVGSWFKVIPPAGATAAVKNYYADAWFKKASSTATVLTLDAATPITGAGLGITAVVGYALSQSIIVNANSLSRTFTLEYALTDITQFLPFRGMRANKMDLSLEVGAIATGSFDFVGRGHDGMVSATTLPGSPIASQSLDVMNAVTDLGLVFENGASILSASSSFIKSIKLSVSNNLRGQKAVGIYGNAGVGYGELEITGSIEAYVENATYYNKWINGTNTSLSIGMADAAGNGYLIDLDKVNFKDGGINAGGRSDDVMLTLPFQAFYNAATLRGLRLTRSIAA